MIQRIGNVTLCTDVITIQRRFFDRPLSAFISKSFVYIIQRNLQVHIGYTICHFEQTLVGKENASAVLQPCVVTCHRCYGRAQRNTPYVAVILDGVRFVPFPYRCREGYA